MHIVTGNLRKKPLLAPKKTPIRPTSAKLREALFHILFSLPEFDLNPEDANFLDLCCGTGAVGFEALSNGFQHISFVDVSSKSLDIAKKNAENLNVMDQCSFFKANATRPYAAKQQHDVIFIDPPYGFKEFKLVIEKFAQKNWLAEKSIWILEHSKHDKISIALPNIQQLDYRQYGDTELSIYQF